MIYNPQGKSFDNLGVGPAISIEREDQKQETINDLLERRLMVVSYITDVEHPAFKLFSDNKELKVKPIGVFLTIYYIQEHYE